MLDTFAPDVLMLVPLDATNHVPVTQTFARQLAARARTREAALVAAIANHRSTLEGAAEGRLYWWDPLCAVAAIHPDVVTTTTMGIAVVVDGPAAGRTEQAAGASRARVATSADRARFEALFLRTLEAAHSYKRQVILQKVLDELARSAQTTGSTGLREQGHPPPV